MTSSLELNGMGNNALTRIPTVTVVVDTPAVGWAHIECLAYGNTSVFSAIIT